MKLFLGIFFLVFLFSGCYGYKNHQKAFNRNYESNNLQEVKNIARKNIETSSNHRLIWMLKLAAIEQACQNYAKSNQLFDLAEEYFRQYDLTSVFNIKDSSAYTGKVYDRILTNTYKALNFLFMNDDENARIEFNRALQRQEQAVITYRREISNQQKANQKTIAQENDPEFERNMQKSLKEKEIDTIISSNYSNIQHFQFYSDFVNPFTTYMAGLFFLLERDFSRAADLLKEAYAMESKNMVIQKDFIDAEKFRLPQNQVWVILESGLGPIRESIRVDIPLFIVTDKVYYTGIALPRLVMRNTGFQYFQVKNNTGFEPLYLVSNMENVIAADFQKELRTIIVQEIIKAGIFAYGQYRAQSSGYKELAIGLAVIQALSNQADTRIWSTLPKEFYIGRIEIPDDRWLQIYAEGTPILHTELPPGNNIILFLQLPTRSGSAVYHIRTF